VSEDCCNEIEGGNKTHVHLLTYATSNVWIMHQWTNNNAELVNHLLKLKAEWWQLPLASGKAAGAHYVTIMDNVPRH